MEKTKINRVIYKIETLDDITLNPTKLMRLIRGHYPIHGQYPPYGVKVTDLTPALKEFEWWLEANKKELGGGEYGPSTHRADISYGVIKEVLFRFRTAIGKEEKE